MFRSAEIKHVGEQGPYLIIWCFVAELAANLLPTLFFAAMSSEDTACNSSLSTRHFVTRRSRT